MPEKKDEVPEIEKAETKETSEEKEKEIVVVKELPMQPTNIGTMTETGEQVELITIEDALTELLQSQRIIKKAVA